MRDTALLVARDIVNYMLSKRPDVRDVMIGRKSRLLIMAESEFGPICQAARLEKPTKEDPGSRPPSVNGTCPAASRHER